MLSKKFKETIFLTITKSSGEREVISFTDGSYVYKNRPITQTFVSCLVDNVGNGLCKVAFEPHVDFINGMEGYKTLFPKDCFYIERTISFIEIYFIEDTSVEIVLGATVYET